VGHRITGRYPGAVNRHHGIGWECRGGSSRTSKAPRGNQAGFMVSIV
jgi:hypothetical protein